MNNSPIEQQAQEAWQKYNSRNQAKFWQYYEHLLVNAKQTQVLHKPQTVQQAPSLPKEKLYAPRSTKAHKPKSSKAKVLAMTFGLLILFVLTFIIDPSANNQYIYPEYTTETKALQAQKKFDWLYARMSMADKKKLDVFLDMQPPLTSKDEAVTAYMEHNHLVDWSKTPTNLYPEVENVYALFTPKDTVVYFVVHHDESVYRILPHQKQYTITNNTGQHEAIPIKQENAYKASLKLKYAEIMPEVDKDGVVYFIEEGKRFDVIKQDYKYLEIVLTIDPMNQ